MNFFAANKIVIAGALGMITIFGDGGYFIQKVRANEGSVAQVSIQSTTTASLSQPPTSREHEDAAVVGLKLRGDDAGDDNESDAEISATSASIGAQIQSSVDITIGDDDSENSSIDINSDDSVNGD